MPMAGWRALLDPDIREFVLSHEGADVSALALKKPPNPVWSYKLILDQIKARAKAAAKVPGWLEVPDFVFPSADLMEQASSWPCAVYKASLIQGARIADLTAGAGIDAAALAQRAVTLVCAEKTPESAEILEHNLGILQKSGLFRADFQVHCGGSEEFISQMPPCDWVYLDPQRREGGRKGRYLFEDCSPDLLSMLPTLRGSGAKVMVKASPVLDIALAIEALGGVGAVHIVQWGGECKEVLYMIDGAAAEPAIHAVEIDDAGQVLKDFRFTMAQEQAAQAEIGSPEAYIYEPGAAFLKAGAFNLLATRLGLRKLHRNTHLYTSDHLVQGFPGKVYRIEDVRSPADGVADIAGAELVLRNYPGSTEALRAKLKLREGDSRRIFACTTQDERKKLIVCTKIACQKAGNG